MSLDRCPWYVAGPLMGLLIVGLRAAVNKPFGALGGYIDLAENALSPSRLGFRAHLLFGLIFGGVLYATTLGSMSAPLSHTTATSFIPGNASIQLALLLVAGTVMGFGARTAGGCTSGHGMSGMALGSPASIASSMTFFATAVALAHGFAWLGGAQ